MKKITFILAILSLTNFSITSCTVTHMSFEPDEKQALFTLSGGTVGTLLAGHLGGFIIGSFIADVGSSTIIEYNGYYTRKRKDALKLFAYKDNKVNLFIEESSFIRKNTESGSSAEAKIQYTILAPADINEIYITEKRRLIYKNKSLELDSREFLRKQGTYVSTIKFRIPQSMPKGDYRLLTTISDGNRSKTAKSFMTII